MKTLNYFYSFVLIIVFAVLFQACGVGKHTIIEKKYQDIRKKDKDITVSYKLPVIKTTGGTTQQQTKGGVTISVEIVPFKATRNVNRNEKATYADPNLTGYDNYEISNTPSYTVTPKNIQFKIRIRNNEQVPLKLSEVGFALIIDGTQWSFPTSYLADWRKGLILTGFDKEYTIQGPQLDGLYNAQAIYLLLNGVPVSHNNAGSITKKSNFKWYFQAQMETVEKTERETFTYKTKRIHKENCSACNGSGTDPKDYKCDRCKGKGSYKSKKKTVKCYPCGGTGIVHYKCDKCAGVGFNEYPKSTEAPHTSTVWTGWNVNVTTNPPGAKVRMVNTKTAEYQSVGISNIESNWYSSNFTSYPIIVEYKGQTVKVLPYNKLGEEISKVLIDFSGGTPIVTEGEKAD